MQYFRNRRRGGFLASWYDKNCPSSREMKEDNDLIACIGSDIEEAFVILEQLQWKVGAKSDCSVFRKWSGQL